MNNDNTKNKPEISDSLISSMMDLLDKLDYKKIKDVVLDSDKMGKATALGVSCLLYTSPSPRD